MIYRANQIPPLPDDYEATEPTGRARRVTNDPQREYTMRAGQVEPLPDAVAALILARKGWALVERHQISISLDSERIVYASRESVTIQEYNGTGRRVLWTVNRRHPEMLHILTPDGRYVESIPQKERARWFGDDEVSKRAYADKHAQCNRDARRLQALHLQDTRMAAEDAAHNASVTTRVINTMPAPGARQVESGKWDRARETADAMDRHDRPDRPDRPRVTTEAAVQAVYSAWREEEEES